MSLYCQPLLSVNRFLVVFFFSSRRRHTRCSRDWSSDVCSSDLELTADIYIRQIVAAGMSLEAIKPGSFKKQSKELDTGVNVFTDKWEFRVYNAYLDNLGSVAEAPVPTTRSEVHTSELQSRLHLVCRLLLEKKKKRNKKKKKRKRER